MDENWGSPILGNLMKPPYLEDIWRWNLKDFQSTVAPGTLSGSNLDEIAVSYSLLLVF